jgi:glycerol-3-phosphate dehydrogenase (NAD(P)+)
VLLERAGLRTTLLCRTVAQADTLSADRENKRYLEGVALPERLKIRVLGGVENQFRRADLIFVAVPSKGLSEALAELRRQGVAAGAGIVSLAKGLVPPDGTPPTVALEELFGPDRVACVGVELAGVAKNAAALAAAAAEQQGRNAAGMAAADIFTEVLALAKLRGARSRTFVGRAGVGDLVATALAPSSRNRSAGELLGQGVPGAEIPDRVGQAVESLETVPLLARAIENAGLEAPITAALARLIDGTLPLEQWIQRVRVSQPEPPRGSRFMRWWARWRARQRSRRR